MWWCLSKNSEPLWMAPFALHGKIVRRYQLIFPHNECIEVNLMMESLNVACDVQEKFWHWIIVLINTTNLTKSENPLSILSFLVINAILAEF